MSEISQSLVPELISKSNVNLRQDFLNVKGASNDVYNVIIISTNAVDWGRINNVGDVLDGININITQLDAADSNSKNDVDVFENTTAMTPITEDMFKIETLDGWRIKNDEPENDCENALLPNMIIPDLNSNWEKNEFEDVSVEMATKIKVDDACFNYEPNEKLQTSENSLNDQLHTEDAKSDIDDAYLNYNTNMETQIETDIIWYKCRQCNYKTKYKSSLKRHFKVIHDRNGQWLNDVNIQWYPCNECHYKTNKRSSLRVHFLRKHDNSGKLYYCPLCTYETKLEVNLRRHYGFKHDENSLWHYCKYCEYKSKCKSHLRQHTKFKHEGTNELYSCKQCDYTAKLEINVKRHFIRKHDDNAELYYCNECRYSTKFQISLKRHYRIKHDENSEWYCCEKCEYKTKVKGDLNKHTKVKHSDNFELYLCDQCDYKTKRKGDLNKHHKVKHNRERQNKRKIATTTSKSFG